MSTIDISSLGAGGGFDVPLPPSGRPLHRLAQVRRQQGVSRRTIARRLNIDAAAIRQQELETSDMTLSQLYRWQTVLDVPISELLVEADEAISPPLLLRAQLVRLMKSALAIKGNVKQESVRRMVQTIIDQLLDMMPELSGVGPWHAVGKRRRLDELGVAAERRLSADVFLDRED
ncbi:MAG: helix-turn-helix transcriptional regulator [Pirellulales bacterium]|nr:helix-turn-helix transcriptional regulator [Pirellulales bacterium]